MIYRIYREFSWIFNKEKTRDHLSICEDDPMTHEQVEDTHRSNDRTNANASMKN